MTAARVDEWAGPGAIRSALRYWALIGLFIVVFLILGAVIYSRTRPQTYEASAGFVVDDVISTTGGNRPIEPKRYIQDQVAILNSRAVADRASELAPTLSPPKSIPATDFLDHTSITPNADSNFITATFSAQDPETAQAGANALVAAYQDVVTAAVSEDTQAATDLLDDAIDEASAEYAALQSQIEEVQAQSSDQAVLTTQFNDIVEELQEVRSRPRSGDAAFLQATTARIDQLAAELRAWQLVSDTQVRNSPETALLVRQRDDILTRLSDLSRQRAQVAVDSGLVGDGVVFFAPAGDGRQSGVSAVSITIISIAVGALIGAGVAYSLSQRRRRFEDRLEPQAILSAPLMAVLAKRRSRRTFFNRRDHDPDVSALPVLYADSSPAAEAFRVLVGALELDATDIRDPGSATQGRVVAVVTAKSRGGTTFVAANTALAVGLADRHVLLVDGNFEAPRSSEVLNRLPIEVPQLRLSEVIREETPVPDAISKIDLDGRARVDLMSGAPPSPRTFVDLADTYDLVTLDIPSLLQTAYAASAVRQADSALVVVHHHDSYADTEELLHQLNLIGVPVIGYVYMYSRFGSPVVSTVAPPRSALAQSR